MTAEAFRALARRLPDVVESSHMEHPDFRVGGRIFATLGYPTDEWGMVILPPEEQARLCAAEPGVFRAVKGAWGRAGSTQVHFPMASAGSVGPALRLAWEKRVLKNDAQPKRTARKAPARRQRPAGQREQKS